MFHNIVAGVSLTIETPQGEHMEPLPVSDGLQIGNGMAYAIPFYSPVNGTPLRVDLARVLAIDPLAQPGPMNLALSPDPEGTAVLAQAQLPPPPRRSTGAVRLPVLSWRQQHS
jgi:hypothetical protein